MDVSIDQTVEIRDTGGKLCGSYHYQDPFKSFFRGLYTPNGKDVVASPPGRVLNPLSSIKTMVRLCCWAFFLKPASLPVASGEWLSRRVPPPGVPVAGN